MRVPGPASGSGSCSYAGAGTPAGAGRGGAGMGWEAAWARPVLAAGAGPGHSFHPLALTGRALGVLVEVSETQLCSQSRGANL